MISDCIYSIDFTTTNCETLSISSDDFENLYIANINDVGDEVPYVSSNSQKESLLANFFMIKILNGDYCANEGFIQRIYEKQDIASITLKFTNGRSQNFELPKKRVVMDGILKNKFQHSHFQEDDLCIIISDKNIKFKNNLFI